MKNGQKLKKLPNMVTLTTTTTWLLKSATRLGEICHFGSFMSV